MKSVNCPPTKVLEYKADILYGITLERLGLKMNRTLYNMLGHIPIAGRFIQIKANVFASMHTPLTEEFKKSTNYKIIDNWKKQHPNQVVSPKLAKELIEKAKGK